MLYGTVNKNKFEFQSGDTGGNFVILSKNVGFLNFKILSNM